MRRKGAPFYMLAGYRTDRLSDEGAGGEKPSFLPLDLSHAFRRPLLLLRRRTERIERRSSCLHIKEERKREGRKHFRRASNSSSFFCIQQPSRLSTKEGGFFPFPLFHEDERRKKKQWMDALSLREKYRGMRRRKRERER